MLPEKLMLFIVHIDGVRLSWGNGKELNENRRAMSV